MLEQIFGELGVSARFVVAFILVLALIALTVWLMRRFGDGGLVSNASGRNRQQRLAVLDSATVDARRRLVLIRRDNVEHLLLIGGPSDVVVEPNIVRAQPAGTAASTASARPAAARPGLFDEDDTSLIPEPIAEPERPAPAPVVHAPVTPPPAPRAPAPAPAAAEPPRVMPRPAQKLDPQYADMAQRLEAALRKPGPTPEPEVARPAPAPRTPEPRVVDQRVTRPPMPRIPEAPPRAEPQLRTPAAPAPRPPAQPTHTEQAADVFASLEEEMASLLRPGGKKEPK